jgi:hypothetical protein
LLVLPGAWLAPAPLLPALLVPLASLLALLPLPLRLNHWLGGLPKDLRGGLAGWRQGQGGGRSVELARRR